MGVPPIRLGLLYSVEKENAIDNSHFQSIIPFGIMKTRRNAYEA